MRDAIEKYPMHYILAMMAYVPYEQELTENNIKELYPCHCTKFYVKAEMFKNLDIKDAHVGLEINW